MASPRYMLGCRRLLGTTTPVTRSLWITASSSQSLWTGCTTSTNSTAFGSLARFDASLMTPTTGYSSTRHQQRRWKHAGKMGHHLETLDEMAHRPEREAAQERRKKQKDKKEVKRKGKKGATAVDESEDALEDDDFDNMDFDDDFETEEGEDEDAEPSLPDPGLVKNKMLGIIDRFQASLKSIRGVEPTAEMFDDVQVNAYGSMTPLKAVGQVVIVSNTLAQITCFDPSVAKEVSKAVQLALSLNPQVEEGGDVKVPLPRVSMEVREQTAAQLKKKAESCRQRVRKLRRKAMDVVKKGKDGKLAGISKDDAFATAKEIESVTESVMNTLQGMVDKKMDSIMAV